VTLPGWRGDLGVPPATLDLSKVLSRELQPFRNGCFERSSRIRDWRESSGCDRGLHPFDGNVSHCVVESPDLDGRLSALSRPAASGRKADGLLSGMAGLKVDMRPSSRGPLCPCSAPSPPASNPDRRRSLGLWAMILVVCKLIARDSARSTGSYLTYQNAHGPTQCMKESIGQ
jgi:hypothetical protein